MRHATDGRRKIQAAVVMALLLISARQEAARAQSNILAQALSAGPNEDSRILSFTGSGCQICETAFQPSASGVLFGTVIGGYTYTYSASGLVGFNTGCDGACSYADPDGNRIENGSPAPPITAGSGFLCPGLIAYSLVGKIDGGQCIQLGSSGSFVAPATGTLILYFNDDIYGDNSGTWNVCMDVVPFVEKCPESFVPKGGTEDNLVVIRAFATPGVATGKFKFTLYEVSDEVGYCLNGPQLPPGVGEDSGAWKDLQFPSQSGFDVSGANNDVAETTASDLSEATITVKSFDYGSYGKLKVEFSVSGAGTPCVATELGSDKQYTNIPFDDDENHIADTASQNSDPTGSAATDDNDNTPTGNGTAGDRLTRYEEYRGFLVSGAHVRTDVAKKDVFYNDANGLGHQDDWTEQNLTAPIQKVTASEMSAAGMRTVTLNRDSHAGPSQRAIRQEKDVDPALRSFFWGESGIGIPYLIGLNRVHTDNQTRGIQYGTSLSAAINGTQSVITLVRPDPDPGWAQSGKLRIENEVIVYLNSVVGASTVTLYGVVRGRDGTQPASHPAGAFVAYFAYPDDVIKYTVAHEAAHACGMHHDSPLNASIMGAPIPAGFDAFNHSFRHSGTVRGSTQEFKVK